MGEGILRPFHFWDAGDADRGPSSGQARSRLPRPECRGARFSGRRRSTGFREDATNAAVGAGATTLKPKGKEAILPVGVETVVASGTMLTVFLFPRTEAISLEDKEVTFQMALGPMRVKSKFRLKDMQYLGKLAL